MSNPYTFNLDRKTLFDEDMVNCKMTVNNKNFFIYDPNFIKETYILSKDNLSTKFTDYKFIPYRINCEVFLQKNDDEIISIKKKHYGFSNRDNAIKFLEEDADNYIDNYKYLAEFKSISFHPDMPDLHPDIPDQVINNHVYFTEISFYLANGQIVWVQHDGMPFSHYGASINMSLGTTYNSYLGRVIRKMLNRNNEYIVKPRTRWHTNEYNEKESALFNFLNKKNYFKTLKEKISLLPEITEYPSMPNQSVYVIKFEEQVVDCMWLDLESFPTFFSKIFSEGMGSKSLPPYFEKYKTCGGIIQKIPNFDHPFFKVLG